MSNKITFSKGTYFVTFLGTVSLKDLVNVVGLLSKDLGFPYSPGFPFSKDLPRRSANN